MIAVDGLRRYGYDKEAERISMEFLQLVDKEYRRQGFIVEKYDVVSGGSNVAQNIHFGYSANQAGFGWTNAGFTHMFDELTKTDQASIVH
jgi:alpha,alpha-trehalase